MEHVMDSKQFIIIGGGLAGATAAKTLRAEGHTGGITLLAAENHVPYIRPPLSKEYLLGKEGEDSAQVNPEDWYAENDVDLRRGTQASAIEPASHTVKLSSGQSLSYDALLLATGAYPRSLDIPGAGLDGVMTFRTLDDSRRLKELLKDGGRQVVMIGSGWIGMELAAAARNYGNNVCVLGREEVPLGKAIGPELGGYFRSLHADNGVMFRLPATASEIRGKDNRVTAVVTDSGEVLPADVVIVAIGVLPDTRLAEAAGLTLDNGILTDASLRSSAPDVFAAGDTANALHPFTGQHYRSEHWANALAAGKVAAKSMLGQDALHDSVPYFYTDQFDVSMEYSGYPSLAEGTAPVLRHGSGNRELMAFWLVDGAMVAGMTINVPKTQKTIKSLIQSRTAVDAALLSDPGVPLDQLLPEG
jgi:NADPH-dependent 2,4-dienoyl-CoA reductase/sulfur reductase-like enzyme